MREELIPVHTLIMVVEVSCGKGVVSVHRDYARYIKHVQTHTFCRVAVSNVNVNRAADDLKTLPQLECVQ